MIAFARPTWAFSSLKRAMKQSYQPRRLWHDGRAMSETERREAGVSADPGVSYAIARLHQLVFASVSQRAARHGLTALQFTTLSVLNRHGVPLSNSQLARRSFMTAQSMHEVIHRLEEDGLIARAPHPEHGRKLLATLTTKGRRVLIACEAAVAEFEATMLKGFTRSDRVSFLKMVKSAVQNLGGGFGDGAAPVKAAGRPPAAPRSRASAGRRRTR
jgi:DNA-binding MarR family transcriptional regulator